jgi:hypothetical protein
MNASCKGLRLAVFSVWKFDTPSSSGSLVVTTKRKHRGTLPQGPVVILHSIKILLYQKFYIFPRSITFHQFSTMGLSGAICIADH